MSSMLPIEILQTTTPFASALYSNESRLQPEDAWFRYLLANGTDDNFTYRDPIKPDARITEIYLAVAIKTFCALMTIFGNILVLLAVVTQRYLRSATNSMVVSLVCVLCFGDL